jgi:uncharacterized protein (TIGR02246 family)
MTPSVKGEHMLTLEDRVAIDQLYAGYCHAFDFGDGPGFAALFTPDGKFVYEGVTEYAGTDALTAFVIDRAEQVPGMRHFTANALVQASEGGASGKAYVFVIRLGDEAPLRLRNTGEYRDEFVRTDAGWRFAQRRFASWIPAELVDRPFELGVA